MNTKRAGASAAEPRHVVEPVLSEVRQPSRHSGDHEHRPEDGDDERERRETGQRLRSSQSHHACTFARTQPSSRCARSNSLAQMPRPRKMTSQPGPGNGSSTMPTMTTIAPSTPTPMRYSRALFGLARMRRRHSQSCSSPCPGSRESRESASRAEVVELMTAKPNGGRLSRPFQRRARETSRPGVSRRQPPRHCAVPCRGNPAPRQTRREHAVSRAARPDARRRSPRCATSWVRGCPRRTAPGR